MQMIIHTKQDLEMLQGKFVLQIDIDKPDIGVGDMRLREYTNSFLCDIFFNGVFSHKIK